MNTQGINERCSCFNLRKATRAVTQYFDHCLEPAGIRATQFTLLVTLASVHAKTLTEMAEHLVMDRTTLTRNLKPLEKMNLIKTMAPRDKRSKAYALSDEGRAKLEKGLPMWQKAQEKVVTGMGEDRFQKILIELGAVIRLFDHQNL